jgi:hypothetical protein
LHPSAAYRIEIAILHFRLEEQTIQIRLRQCKALGSATSDFADGPFAAGEDP